MGFINRKYTVWAVLLLSATTACNQSVWTRRQAENYKLSQYRNTLAEVRNITRLENQRLAYVIPTTFRYAYGQKIWPYSDISLQESVKRDHIDESTNIPSQFSVPKIISIQEQQRAIQEEANEKLYRTQADPSYYENAKRAFQAEYKRRMSAKDLK